MKISEKFEFASTLLKESLAQRDEFHRRFLDLIKLIPVVFAATGYLFSQKINPIVFFGTSIDWYNFVIILNAILLICFSILAVWCFFFPPKYRIGATYREQLEYIDQIEKYIRDNEIKDSFSDFYKTQQLSVLAEDAANNDDMNSKQRKRMNWLQVVAILLFLSYLVPIMFLAAR